MRVAIVVEHLQNQLLALQLITRNRKLEVLIEVRIRFATMNVSLTLATIHIGLQHETHVGIAETALLDGAQIVCCNQSS